MSPSRTSFLRSLCSHSCCAEELPLACSSSFSTSLPPYVLYTCLEALPRIRPLHKIYCLPTTFLQQALVQKNQWVHVWREILVPCMFMYIHRILPLLPSIFSHKMENNSHSVWILVCCCTFNLKPDIFFFFCSSLIQDCFKLLSMSVPLISFTVFFSPSSFLTIEKISMLAN